MPRERYLHIPKSVFVAHKKEFKAFLTIRLYTIASLYWEHETSIRDIAQQYEVSRTRIYQILAVAREKMVKEGYVIE